MKHRLFLLIAILFGFFLFPSITASQTFKFDVKTKFEEKKQLSHIKSGVLGMIESTTWAASAEFGEDYSLWLKNLRRIKGNGDTVILLLDVELRSPAMIGSGKLVSAQTIRVVYNASDIVTAMEGDSTGMFVQRYFERHNLLKNLATVSINVFLPGSNIIIAVLTKLFINEIGREPNSAEIYEGAIVGGHVILAVDEMLRKAGSSQQH